MRGRRTPLCQSHKTVAVDAGFDSQDFFDRRCQGASYRYGGGGRCEGRHDPDDFFLRRGEGLLVSPEKKRAESVGLGGCAGPPTLLGQPSCPRYLSLWCF